MIRIEYTIDGKMWNHISTDFNNLVDANDYINKAEIRDYATQIKFLTITKEQVVRLQK